jgi:hypothetical protein
VAGVGKITALAVVLATWIEIMDIKMEIRGAQVGDLVNKS